MRRVALAMLIPLAIIMFGLLFINRQEPDFADLAPAPDSIIWRHGDITTLWLNTNRHAVDLRVSSKDIGISEIDMRDPASGEPVQLGEGLGCLSVAVSKFEISASDTTTMSARITVERSTSNPTIHFRWRQVGSPHWPIGTSVIFASGETMKVVSLTGLTEGAEYEAEASTDQHYPPAITRRITFTAGDMDSATIDNRVLETHLLEDTGVGLEACAEHEDTVITLHGDDGKELNRYLVDVLPANTPTPTPTPSPTPTATPVPAPPAFSANYAAVTLSGTIASGDSVIRRTATNSPSYELATEQDYALFSVSNTGAITVNTLGANEFAALASGAVKLYTVRLVASNQDGQDSIVVAVQVTKA